MFSGQPLGPHHPCWGAQPHLSVLAFLLWWVRTMSMAPIGKNSNWCWSEYSEASGYCNTDRIYFRTEKKIAIICPEARASYQKEDVSEPRNELPKKMCWSRSNWQNWGIGGRYCRTWRCSTKASWHPSGSWAYLEQVSANIPEPLKLTWAEGQRLAGSLNVG